MQKKIIIVTYGRSGSTLLSRLISSIDNAHIAGENFDLLREVFHSVRKAHEARRKATQFRSNENEPWYMTDKIDVAAYGAAMVEAFFAHVVQPPAGSAVVGFKEIRFFAPRADFEAYMNFIRDYVPSSFIIFNRRNVEDLSKSGWYAKKSKAVVLREIAGYDAMMTDYAAANPSRAILADYDDYTLDVRALKPVFDLIGEPFDAARLQSVIDVPLTHGARSNKA